MTGLAVAIATVFGIGRLPIAPATWASAFTTAVVWFLWPVNPTLELLVIMVLLPVSIWSAHVAEKRLGHDAHPIVIDEVVGQLIVFWGIPREFGWMAAGFILFRVFDIAKPLGINRLQNLPGGVGIVVDDVVAGIYGWILLMVAYQLLPRFLS